MDRLKISDNTTVSVKHVFNSHEAHQNALGLAQFLKDKGDKEEEFKSVKKQFADAIGLIDKNIKVKMNHVNDGYKYVEVPADIYLDFEEHKRYSYNKNTGDEISCDDFTNSDFQAKTDHLAALERKKQLALNLDDPSALNNAVGDYAEGGADHIGEDGFFTDHNGNLTDIPPKGDALDQVIDDKKSGYEESLPPNKKSGLFDKKDKNSEDNLPPS